MRTSDAKTNEDRRRREDLSRLLPLWPGELDDLTIGGRERLIAKLERALRAERRRGRSGHWAYDLARHAALYRIWRVEVAELKTMRSREKRV